MKKTLLAATLSTIFAVPVIAETTIYGNFRGSLNTGDLNGADNSAKFENNASRLGVKGSIGKNGLKGLYHLQMGANNDAGGAALSSRFYYAGLQGGFGKVLVGRLSTPYKMAGVKQDPFYDTSAGPANGGSNYGYSSLNNGFTDNTIAYYSPKIAGGLSVNATAAVDDAITDDHDYGVGVEYAAGPMKVGLGYLDLGDTPVIASNGGAKDAIRLYGSTTLGAIGLNASYESVDLGLADKTTYVAVNGTYKVSPKVKLAASYGTVKDGVAAGRDGSGDGYTLGAFYNVLKNTQLSALYTNTDYDDVATADRDGVALGVVQKF